MGATALAVIGSGALAVGLLTQGDDPFDEARFGGRGGAPTAVVPTGGEDEEGGAAVESAGTDRKGSASPSASPSRSSAP
ncbi:hypothetical protein ACSNOF_23540, partial [Streptomyces sp. URMC 125]